MVLTRVFHFAKGLRCSADCVCGYANCLEIFEKTGPVFKTVLKQLNKTIN